MTCCNRVFALFPYLFEFVPMFWCSGFNCSNIMQEEPPHKGRTTEDCNIQCKNISKRWTRARTGRWTERKQHEMGRDRARRSPKKRGKFHNSPKWPPAVPLWGQQWTIRCRFPHKQEMERQHNKSILWEFHSSRTSPTHNRHIPTEDRSSICANEFSLRWRDRQLLQHHW